MDLVHKMLVVVEVVLVLQVLMDHVQNHSQVDQVVLVLQIQFQVVQ